MLPGRAGDFSNVCAEFNDLSLQTDSFKYQFRLFAQKRQTFSYTRQKVNET
jgi:hypothetical protein